MEQFLKEIRALSPKQLLILAVRQQSKLGQLEQSSKEPIAIVGMGCRSPGGASDPQSFWRLLSEGMDAIGKVPEERWSADALYDPDRRAPGKIVTRNGGFLHDIDRFDPEFFGISPKEAEAIDPQQRLLLEVAWEALEHAGINPEKLQGQAGGVFVGISNSEYVISLMAGAESNASIGGYTFGGSALSGAAGRVSYVLGLNGPSISMDTACSSSLSALHLACQSLRRRECHLALAGGVNMIILPTTSIGFSKAGMLSEDGRCKTFDESADGYGRSEGAGMVVLKRLSDALKDRDPILALIRGSAVNHNGPSGALSVPNGLAQQAVIRQALSNAGLEPKDISYIEAHGTGTAIGDAIEMGAVGAVFSASHSHQHPLTVASLKTNLGHMEAAAGIGGLIKVVLQLQHKKIAPHLHWQQPSSRIDWRSLPVRVPTTLTDWETEEGQPRRAGLSSFGFSGTNAHLILEEAPASAVVAAESTEQSAEQNAQQATRPRLLTITAKTPTALQQLAAAYAQRFRQVQQLPLSQQQEQLANICFTSHVGRAHFQHRLALVATSAAQMQQRLELAAKGEEGAGIMRGEARDSERGRIALLFTGQGAQAEGEQLEESLGEMYVRGQEVKWEEYEGEEIGRRRKESLPTYPFQRQRFWLKEVGWKSATQTGQAHSYITQSAQEERATAPRSNASGPAPEMYVEQLCSMPPAERQAHVIAYLQHEVSNMLQVDVEQVSPDAYLFGPEMDSLLMVNAMSSLEASLRLKLDPTEIYARLTIKSLAKYLLAEFERTHGEVSRKKMKDACEIANFVEPTADDIEAFELYDESASVRELASPEHQLREMREEYVEVRGQRLCLCMWGPDDGVLAVCVHGFRDQGAAWEKVALSLVASGHRVVAPDLRGHGRSSHMSPGSSLTLVDLVADLDDLTQRLSREPFTLIGHSMGSVIAATFASIRQERVAELVLVEPVLPPQEDEQEIAEQFAALVAERSTPFEHPAFSDLNAAAARLMKSTPSLTEPLALALARRVTEPYEGGLRWRWDSALRSPLAVIFGLSRAKYLSLLGQLRMAVTLLYGRASHFHCLNYLDEQRRVLPQAEIVIAPGGHNLHLEMPEIISAILTGSTVTSHAADVLAHEQ